MNTDIEEGGAACFLILPNQQLFTPVKGSDTEWIVRYPIDYYSNVLGKVITVPAGFITDLASIPRLLWWLYPPSGKYDLAVVLHDILYWRQETSRKDADLVLHEAMLVCGCKKGVANNFYFAVRVGGQAAWDNNAKQDKATGFVKLTGGIINVSELEI